MENDNVLKVNDVNGRPVKIVFEAMSGIVFHITPTTLATYQAVVLKSEDKFSYPDKEAYEIPDPDEVSFMPGQASKAEDNPEYVKLCKAVDFERSQWRDRAIFDYVTTCPAYPTPDALVAAFRPQLERLKAIAQFDDDDTDYDIVLLHLVLTGNVDGIPDYVRIIRLAVQQLPLTAEEISNGIRFFRPKVSRN